MEQSDTIQDMTAAASLSLADSYFVDEEYDEAVNAYAAAISLLQEKKSSSSGNDDDNHALLHIRALSHRSAAFYKLERYEEALEDSNRALELLSSSRPSGLRAGEGELCHKRSGLASWKLYKFAEAKESLEQAAQLAGLNNRPHKLYTKWIGECDAKLAKIAAKEKKKEEEIKQKPTPVPAPAPTTSQKDTAIEEVTPADAKPAPAPTKVEQKPAATTSTTATTTNRPTTTTSKRPTMPKYQYYQSDKVMTISILEPGVTEENLDVNFESLWLTVILRKQGVDFTVIAGTLYSEIDVEKSKVVIKDEKVLIKLKKIKQYEWHELFGKPDDSKPNSKPKPKPKAPPVAAAAAATAAPATGDTSSGTPPPPAAAAAPTPAPVKARPYASHRDWDAIEKDIAEEEKNETPKGDDAMNKLFKQIYADADDDTRRAMIKSYQTSGGTVLSTNWDEVGTKDYEKERTAPKGLEWKNWEGDKLPMKDDD